MKICLDLRTVGNGGHGIARYGMELTRALLAMGGSHGFCVLALRGDGWEGLEEAGACVIRCSARPYSVWEQLLVPFVVARLRPDIYHCTTYACPVLVPVPTLFTIHDLLPLEHPQDFSGASRMYHRSFVRWATRWARRVVTPSSYTLGLVCDRLGVPARKVCLIPEGGEHVLRAEATREDERAYGETNPDDLDYFLSVANPRPHKNILFSIRSFLGSERLRAKKVRYVLAGQQHPSVYAYVRDRDREGQIRFAGEVSDRMLCLLYGRALAFLCPSRGEGFCLPVVEAMQFGLPVIAANHGALPEVLGPVGRLLAPDDGRGWQTALEDIYETRKQRAWNPATVRERAAEFTWARAAEKTMRVYEEVVKERC
jgi:glycosyltransferase involved in cell wall biosynthesis